MPSGVPNPPSAWGVGSLSEVDLQPAPLAQALERDPLRRPVEHRVEQLLVGLLETWIVEAEPGGEEAEHLGVGLRLAERRDRRLVVGDVVVPPREQRVEVLELRGDRQHHVGVAGGVGHELVEHDREQVVALEPGQHA